MLEIRGSRNVRPARCGGRRGVGEEALPCGEDAVSRGLASLWSPLPPIGSRGFASGAAGDQWSDPLRLLVDDANSLFRLCLQTDRSSVF